MSDFEFGSEKRIVAVDLGLIDYNDAWDIQRRAFQLRQEGRVGDLLLFAEHNPVYTFGTGGDENHLLLANEELVRAGAVVYHVERGGDVTFHGPGQVVGYPVLDLKGYYQDLHRYLRELEEVIVRTIRRYGIEGTRDDRFTGVWVGNEKIAAIGVKVRQWVTMHGFALNVNTDLGYFDHIIPCGIFHKGVTSIRQILGSDADCARVREDLSEQFGTLFNVRISTATKELFLQHLESMTTEGNQWHQPANQTYGR